MQIVIYRDKLIANVVGAELAPPENKTSNFKTGRPRPTSTISAICLVNYIYIQQFICSNSEICYFT